jgi:hypothetical protein
LSPSARYHRTPSRTASRHGRGPDVVAYRLCRRCMRSSAVAGIPEARAAYSTCPEGPGASVVRIPGALAVLAAGHSRRDRASRGQLVAVLSVRMAGRLGHAGHWPGPCGCAGQRAKRTAHAATDVELLERSAAWRIRIAPTSCKIQ